MHLYRLLLLLIAVISCGCNQASPSAYSENDVTQKVSAGMPRVEVEAIFGRASVTQSDDKSTIAIYRVPAKALPRSYDWRFVGFEVRYTNEHVSDWSSIYGDRTTPGMTQQLRNSSRPIPKAERAEKILFYSVSNSDFEGATYINTQGLPQIGYVRKEADFTINGVDSVTVENQRRGSTTVPSIMVRLQRDDVGPFANFTEHEVGARILIGVGQTWISAPYLLSPITNGELMMTLGPKQDADNIVQQLKALEAK